MLLQEETQNILFMSIAIQELMVPAATVQIQIYQHIFSLQKLTQKIQASFRHLQSSRPLPHALTVSAITFNIQVYNAK